MKKSFTGIRSYSGSTSVLARSGTRGKTRKGKVKEKEEDEKKFEFGMYSLCLMRDISPSLKNEALRSDSTKTDIDLRRAREQHDKLAEALLSTGCGKYLRNRCKIYLWSYNKITSLDFMF